MTVEQAKDKALHLGVCLVLAIINHIMAVEAVAKKMKLLMQHSLKHHDKDSNT
jgi:hypothetical protein